MGIGVAWAAIKFFLGSWLKAIWGALKWFFTHPIAIAGAVGIIAGCFLGGWWVTSKAEKKVALIQAELDERDKAEVTRLSQIGLKSTSDADKLAASTQEELDKANRTVAEYKGLLEQAKNAKQIVYVPQVIRVPAQGNTPDHDVKVVLGLEKDNLVCDRFPSMTADQINKLIKGSNDWYPGKK